MKRSSHGFQRPARAARKAAIGSALRERWRIRQHMTEEEHRLIGSWSAGRLGPDRDWSLETLELTAQQIEQHGRITFVGQDTVVAIRDVLARLEKQT